MIRVDSAVKFKWTDESYDATARKAGDRPSWKSVAEISGQKLLFR